MDNHVRVVLRILGAVEIDVDGAPARYEGNLLTGKPLALLLLLALRKGEPATPQALSAELWEDKPSASMGSQFRNYKSAIVRSLGGDVVRTVERSNAVWLDTAGGRVTIDSAELERRCAAVSDLLTDQRYEECVVEADRALMLWRGVPYTGVRELAPFARERVRLTMLHDVLEESRWDARLALGHHASDLGAIANGAAARMDNQHRMVQLITALVRCGRPRDALNAYELARKHFREAGVEPGEELRRAYEVVLQGLPDLNWRPPPEPVTAPVPQTLREAAARFVGRTDEVAAIASSWGSVAAVMGVPGIGKSTLAARVAIDCEEDPDDPADVLYTTWDGRDDALAPILRALGLTRRSFDPMVVADEICAALRRRAARRRTVLILDNVHEADDHTAALLQRLVRAGESRLLVIAVGRRHPTTDAIAAIAGGRSLVLGGLHSSEVGQLLRNANVAERVGDVEAAGLSGAVPLLVDAIVRLAARGEAAGRADDPSRWERPLARLFDALGANSRAIVATLAVVGDRAEVSTLADVAMRAGDLAPRSPSPLLASSGASGWSGLDLVAVSDALDEAAELGLVETVPLPRFRHALIREAVLESLSSSHRRRLALAAYQTLGLPLWDRARHGFGALPLVATDDVLGTAEEARKSAESCGRYAALASLCEAELALRSALPVDASEWHLHDAEVRHRLRLQLVSALEQCGRTADAAAMREAALQEAERAARFDWAAATVLRSSVQGRTMFNANPARQISRALALDIGGGDRRLQLRLRAERLAVAGIVGLTNGFPQEDLRLVEQAACEAESSDDEAYALRGWLTATLGDARLDLHHQRALRLVDLAEELNGIDSSPSVEKIDSRSLNDVDLLSDAYGILIRSHLRRGDLTSAMNLVRVGDRHELVRPIDSFANYLSRSCLATLRGDVSGGSRLAVLAAELGQRFEIAHAPGAWLLQHLASTWHGGENLIAGHPHLFPELFRPGSVEARESESPYDRTVAAAFRALAGSRLGFGDGARELLRVAIDRFQAGVHWSVLPTAAAICQAAWELNDDTVPAWFPEFFAEHGEALVVVGLTATITMGPAARYVALSLALRRTPQHLRVALEVLAEARTWCADRGLKVWEAACWGDAARILEELGDESHVDARRRALSLHNELT